MLLTVPFAEIWANKTHTVRLILARIASTLVPVRNLDPTTHEALCYACMAGIVMPLVHHTALPHPPRERGHVDE